ncbi:hypothetical protein AbraIFM66950_005281 [Aspergillus brasiliensis]|nr:hypothetical protein AbraIFM66950_005281 [Aspergillus brasiliensis]
MAVKDTLLSLDMGFEDCLYRIRRDNQTRTRVVYVALNYLDLIPEESRTYGPDVIRELSKLREWYDETWETLTVYKDGNDGIRSERDLFPPHALRKQQIPGDYELVNIFDLQILVILGYVFEETPHRVMGCIIEEVNGYRPSASDFGACQIALQQLHDLDIVHGDLNKHNMFITDEGVKFIDFEGSYVGPAENEEDWDKRKSTEMQRLMGALLDKSGKGCPWTADDDDDDDDGDDA